MARLPDFRGTTDNPALDSYIRDLKRAVQDALTRLEGQYRLPAYTTTNLPPVALPMRWIAVSTGTGTAQALVPAYNDGTNWRTYATATSTL